MFYRKSSLMFHDTVQVKLMKCNINFEISFTKTRYSLTDKGCELAHKLEKVEMHSDDDGVPFRINEPDIAPPPPNEAFPPRLPTMHGNGLDETEDVNHAVEVPMLSNRLISICQYFEICLFVWGVTPYQRYFSYLTATVHKSMFPGLF